MVLGDEDKISKIEKRLEKNCKELKKRKYIDSCLVSIK